MSCRLQRAPAFAEPDDCEVVLVGLKGGGEAEIFFDGSWRAWGWSVGGVVRGPYDLLAEAIDALLGFVGEKRLPEREMAKLIRLRGF